MFFFIPSAKHYKNLVYSKDFIQGASNHIDTMSINDARCFICGEELNVENYYYVAAGRLQQGVMSDPKAYSEYTLCSNCYAQVNGELMASLRKHKMKKEEDRK
jgi:hypothetical protein